MREIERDLVSILESTSVSNGNSIAFLCFVVTFVGAEENANPEGFRLRGDLKKRIVANGKGRDILLGR